MASKLIRQRKMLGRSITLRLAVSATNSASGKHAWVIIFPTDEGTGKIETFGDQVRTLRNSRAPDDPDLAHRPAVMGLRLCQRSHLPARAERNGADCSSDDASLTAS